MDRIVNVRLNADLAQAIQQFTQLNQVVTQLGTNMAGLGGGFGGGGMGGGFGGFGGFGGGAGNPIGGLGGGIGGPGGGGGGGIMPAGNQRNQNRGPAPRNPGGGPGGNGYTHPGITSQMFGLAQIGFALEDYQYAGWRGVMNNVPWIANALGNVAGGVLGFSGLGSGLLLGTAIGVPLANAAYESMSPETLDRITKMLGGLGQSDVDISGMRSDRLEQQLARTSSLNFRSVQMEQDLFKARMQEGSGRKAKEYFYNPFKPDISNEARAGMEAGLDQYKRTGGADAFNKDWKSAFDSDLKRRAGREADDYYDNSSSLGIFLQGSYQLGRSAWDATFSGKTLTEEFNAREARFFEEKANAELTNAYNSAMAKVGDAINTGDKKKLEEAIKLPVVPESIRKRLREMLKAVTKAEAEARQDRADAETMAEDDRLYADAEEGRMMQISKLQEGAASSLENMNSDIADARRGAAVVGGRFGSQISAIIRGSKTGADAASAIEEFLRRQGVAEDRIGAMVTQEFQQGIQDAKDGKPQSDDELWAANSNQWIAAVKSDLLQAQAASWQNGKFNARVFNTYAARIKQRIADDLGKAGVTRANRQSYAKMIYDAAYQEADEQYKNAQQRGIAQMETAGVRAGHMNAGMVNAAAMSNLVGEMSDDLTAVYGVANSNTFMMQRMYDQQLRRRQIMLSRFQR